MHSLSHFTFSILHLPFFSTFHIFVPRVASMRVWSRVKRIGAAPMRIKDETDKQKKTRKNQKKWQGKLLWVAAWNERGVVGEQGGECQVVRLSSALSPLLPLLAKLQLLASAHHIEKKEVNEDE
jgi:hypothetical protein